MDALLTDINQAGLGRGLQFELFKPAAQETRRDFYAELPITIKVTGNYHDIGAFASDIGKLSRIVTLNEHRARRGRQGRRAGAGRDSQDLPLPGRRGSWRSREGRHCRQEGGKK